MATLPAALRPQALLLLHTFRPTALPFPTPAARESLGFALFTDLTAIAPAEPGVFSNRVFLNSAAGCTFPSHLNKSVGNG